MFIAALAVLVCTTSPGCTTSLELGERRYREGDRLAALQIWRRIPPDGLQYDAAQQRISAVEGEFRQLVVRYRQRAKYFERKDRLAEAVLSWRLAARLAPEEGDALARAQELSRELATRKREGLAALRGLLDRGDLATATPQLEALRNLDPFDPEVTAEAQRLDSALREQVEHRLADGRRSFTSARWNEAERAFRAVLALDPGNESAQGYLSYVGQLRADDERAQRGSRPSAESRASASPVPAQKGAHATADARSSGAPAPSPRRADATDAQIRAEGLHQNALAAARRGDPWQAIRFEQRALAADPQHDGARRQLAGLRATLAHQVDELVESGRAAFMQEDLQGALDQWRRALLADPQNEKAKEYVARAEKLLENLEQLRDDNASAP